MEGLTLSSFFFPSPRQQPLWWHANHSGDGGPVFLVGYYLHHHHPLHAQVCEMRKILSSETFCGCLKYCCCHGNCWWSTTHDCNELVSLNGCVTVLFLLTDRFKKYKQAGSHSNSFRLTNGRSDDTGEAIPCPSAWCLTYYLSPDVTTHLPGLLLCWWHIS